MPPMRVGVVGVGHMGQYHVGAYSEIANAQIAGVADPRAEGIRELAGSLGIDVFEDYRDLYGKVDAVSVAVPTSLHFGVVKDLLEQGIHVLVEKPIAPSMDEARALFEIAGQRNLQLQIGHVERFNAAVLEIKKIIDAPYLIESRRIGPFTGRSTDMGVVLDLLIHDVDIVMNLVDRPVTRVLALGRPIVSEREDLVSVLLEFEGGAIANLTASRVSEFKSRTLSVSQKGAYIALDYTNQEIDIHHQAASSYVLSTTQLKYKQESFIERIFVHKQNPLRLELQHFLECVAGVTPRMTTPEQELRSLRVALDVLALTRKSEGAPS
ncbi:Gfo/Idh/MocA family oxidoreductase [bacterium]|nr:Gfo/Idh/MocA family oxidoreductase [bacterium]